MLPAIHSHLSHNRARATSESSAGIAREDRSQRGLLSKGFRSEVSLDFLRVTYSLRSFVLRKYDLHRKLAIEPPSHAVFKKKMGESDANLTFIAFTWYLWEAWDFWDFSVDVFDGTKMARVLYLSVQSVLKFKLCSERPGEMDICKKDLCLAIWFMVSQTLRHSQ